MGLQLMRGNCVAITLHSMRRYYTCCVGIVFPLHYFKCAGIGIDVWELCAHYTTSNAQVLELMCGDCVLVALLPANVTCLNS